MPQQEPTAANPYGQNPLLQQPVPQTKKFKIPNWIFWAALIGVAVISFFLIFF